MSKKIKIILAKPMGFCAGVKRAVEILEVVIKKNNNQREIYALHEIVHNKSVVDYFTEKGVIFVNDINKIPDNSIIVLSAHGVPLCIKKKAKEKKLTILDATCPLVTKVHNEIKKFKNQGMSIIIIGDKNHAEVKGTAGQVPLSDVKIVYSNEDIENLTIKNEKVAYVMQTTISLDKAKLLEQKIKEKFNNIISPPTDDICYATQNRQKAVIKIAKMIDVLIVIGCQNSSNSNQLREIGIRMGISKSFLINSKNEIKLSWFDGAQSIGVTAGASAPNESSSKIIKHLQKLLDADITTIEGEEEKILFKVPEKSIQSILEKKY